VIVRKWRATSGAVIPQPARGAPMPLIISTGTPLPDSSQTMERSPTVATGMGLLPGVMADGSARIVPHPGRARKRPALPTARPPVR